MPRDIKELIAEVEKHGFAVGSPIPVTGATSELFGNLQPVEPSQSLLHYLPLHRLTSLISGTAIYLRRLDLFQDQYEGKLPAANDSQVSDFTGQFMGQFGMTDKDVKNWKAFLTGTNRKLTYVHCWFASDNEDVSMWRDYADGGKGVCVRTTARRLVDAISRPGHLGLELRRVTYTGEHEALPEIISCLPAGRKQARPEFVREREIRIIATVTEQAWAAGFATPNGEPPDHQLVAVNFERLSDYFYIWLRRSLQPAYPQLLGTVLVPKAEELVADPFRHGGKEQARGFFERGMTRVFERMRETSDPRFPTTIYYAFKQAEDDDDSDDDIEEIASSRASTGWETFLQGLVDTGWQVDGTWPMRTEGMTRMRNMSSNALASSIILVCRPRPKDMGVASRRDFLAALKRELPEALRNLQKGNIAPVDLAQAAIGPGMAVFSRFARVLETDGSPMGVRTALSLINQSLDEVLAEQEGEFDADTRWALAWFDQYGFTEGAYGQAETLSTAKNTSVSGMVEAGILAAKGGKVRLLKKEELPADWDPAADTRLTIWESTHYLIRALDQGEQAAAELLRKLGAVAEIARDLSYRLYTVCERRKWSQDAIGYNALVLAWPDLTRLAQEQKAAGPAQGELI